jgi:hypothetical protein
MQSRGQGSLEYLLLIGGAVLISTVILLMVLSTNDVGGNFLGNQLSGYNAFTNSYFSGGNNPGTICGNGIIEGSEPCEENASGGSIFPSPYASGDCDDYPGGGFTSGNLSCNVNVAGNSCTLDISQCQSGGNPCGNGVCDVSESFASCPQDCTCGNGVCDATESNATCPGDCPSTVAPPTLSLSGLPGGNKRATLSWSILTDFEAGAYTYQIKGGAPGAMNSITDAISFAAFTGNYNSGLLSVAQTGTVTNSPATSSLANGSSYDFRMLACNSGGCSVSPVSSVSLPSRCTSGNCKYWFHPNNGKTKNTTNDPLFYTYSHDGYLTEANWPMVVNTIDVFGYFLNMVQNAQQPWYDSHLKLLNENGVRVSVEVGGVRVPGCDPNGTGTYAADKATVYNKLAAAGSDDFIVSMDNVFSYNVIDGYYDKYDDPNSCKISGDDVSQIMVNYINALKNDFPEAEIGWVEAIPLFYFGPYPSETPTSTPPDPNLRALASIFFTKAQAQGATLHFFHVDQTFTAFLMSGLITTNPPDGPYDKMKAVQNYMQGQNVQFGILLNADSNAVFPNLPSNTPVYQQIFHDYTIGYYDCYLSKGGAVDEIMIESWKPYPYYTVLETDAYTASNVMLDLIAASNASTHTCNFPLGTFP